MNSTHQDKPLCTLECMVWPIRTGRNLPLNLKGMGVHWPKIQYTLISSMIFLGKSVNTVLAERTKPNVFHITMREYVDSGEDVSVRVNVFTLLYGENLVKHSFDHCEPLNKQD